MAKLDATVECLEDFIVQDRRSGLRDGLTLE